MPAVAFDRALRAGLGPVARLRPGTRRLPGYRGAYDAFRLRRPG